MEKKVLKEPFQLEYLKMAPVNYWFPLKENPEMGDLVRRVLDARQGYWASIPCSRPDAEELKGKYGINVEFRDTPY